MREKKFSFVAALWWCLGLAMLGAFLLAFAPREPRESYSENRMLAGFPALTADSVLSGAFMSGMEDFLSDGFFDRDSVIALSDSLLSTLDRRTDEDRLLMDDTEEKLMELVGVYGDEAENEAAVEETEPYEDEDEIEAFPEGTEPYEGGGEPAASRRDAVERQSLKVTRRGRLLASAAPLSGASTLEAEPAAAPAAVSAFDPDTKYALWMIQKDGDTPRVYTYSEENMRTFAQTLDLCRTLLPEDGTVSFAQVPISTTAQRWTEQRHIYTGWRSNMEDGLQALAGEGVYVYNTLALLTPAMESKEKVYFTMDHHWTPLGAYYVCAQMLADRSYPVLPYDEYDYDLIKSKKNRDGSRDQLDVLRSLLPAHSLIVTHLTQEEEIPLMSLTGRTYVVFMNNTRTPWRRVITGFHTGRNALVLCDSFGNAFTPYLLPYYDEVHMADPRKGCFSAQEAGGTMSELIRYFGIDDIYVILSTANGVNSNNGLVSFRNYLTE